MIDVETATNRIMKSIARIGRENSWVQERGAWKESLSKVIASEIYHQELMTFLRTLIYEDQNTMKTVIGMIGHADTVEDRQLLINAIKESATDIAVLGFFESALGDDNLDAHERANIVKCCKEYFDIEYFDGIGYMQKSR